jgi:hypothetical protein
VAVRDQRPDRRHLPARVSLEMFPARGIVAVFEAPRDASSLAVSRRDTCHRRRESSLVAVRIAFNRQPPGTPPSGEGEIQIRLCPSAQPSPRGAVAVDMRM